MHSTPHYRQIRIYRYIQYMRACGVFLRDRWPCEDLRAWFVIWIFQQGRFKLGVAVLTRCAESHWLPWLPADRTYSLSLCSLALRFIKYSSSGSLCYLYAHLCVTMVNRLCGSGSTCSCRYAWHTSLPSLSVCPPAKPEKMSSIRDEGFDITIKVLLTRSNTILTSDASSASTLGLVAYGTGLSVWHLGWLSAVMSFMLPSSPLPPCPLAYHR